ncbi:hypothetical protein ILYODFUR_011794 [Ilyodon furcidens]|uniref:Uncharacterized protein n=1 Tax=Ilyodon furcidens TaxID=33524 RepID=A0ABV0SW84_9TELE
MTCKQLCCCNRKLLKGIYEDPTYLSLERRTQFSCAQNEVLRSVYALCRVLNWGTWSSCVQFPSAQRSRKSNWECLFSKQFHVSTINSHLHPECTSVQDPSSD